MQKYLPGCLKFLTILSNRSGKIIDIVDPTIPEKRPKTNISKFKVLFYPKEKVEVLNDIIWSLN